mmetsp:Transcript_42196/g.49303  ORF Transcript_42196/g.49303 Transcript_42196/m.49303 type:complete len:420 (+) Transcript_42196:93-1352(+)
MKFSQIACISFALILDIAKAVPRKHHELSSEYEFETYLTDFRKSYGDTKSVEYKKRAKLFTERLDDILKHNADESNTYKKGVNKFTDMDVSEMHFGFNKAAHPAYNKSVSSTSRRMASTELPFELKEASDLPTSVDWRVHDGPYPVVSAVKDQGGCGSCWAFAATAVLESHIAIETGTLFNLSPQEFVSCMPNEDHCGGTGGCMGGTTDMAYDWMIASGGIVEEYQMGYTSYHGGDGECSILQKNENNEMIRGTKRDGPDPKGITGAVATIDGYSILPSNDYHALLNAVAQHGPVAVAVAASSWGAYEGGVYQADPQDETNYEINHGVVVVGYGVDEDTKLDYWLVRNSWGPKFGELGYIRILREEPPAGDNLLKTEYCGLDINPADGIACEGDFAPVSVCGSSGILFDSVIPTGGLLK